MTSYDKKSKRQSRINAVIMSDKKTQTDIAFGNKKKRKRSSPDKNNLKFFVDRSSETVERTLNIVQKLQQEISQLKDGLVKADNEFRNLNQFIQENKKKNKDLKN
jgi:molecular chaperone GrpE (heat shock protein)